MGNVGNIEKVMVFGILLIILSILAIAIWGNNAVDEPTRYDEGPVPAVSPEAALDLKIESPRAPDQAAPGSGRPERVHEDLVSTPSVAELEAARQRSTPRELSVHPPEPAAATKSEPVAAAKELPTQYTVKANDTFEGIAVQLFGSPRFTDELMKANEDVDPRRLRVGQVLNVPRLAGALAPAAGDGPVADGAVVVNSVPAAGAGLTKTYRVREGDTLYGISREIYGTTARWEEIWNANRQLLPKANDLRPGMVLELPQL